MRRLKTKFCLCCLHFPTRVSFANFRTYTPTKCELKSSCWTSLLYRTSAHSVSPQTTMSVFFCSLHSQDWTAHTQEGVFLFLCFFTLPGGNCQVSVLITPQLLSSTFFENSYPGTILSFGTTWSDLLKVSFKP
jgi:hypothetical protein